MTNRWIWLIPSKTRVSFASRNMHSTSKPFMYPYPSVTYIVSVAIFMAASLETHLAIEAIRPNMNRFPNSYHCRLGILNAGRWWSMEPFTSRSSAGADSAPATPGKSLNPG